MKKFISNLFIIVLTLFTAKTFALGSIPDAPQSKGQFAWILSDTVSLHSKADMNSNYTELDSPEEWISVSDATRDKNNNLWYKVKINGRQGWIFQTGVRLKMGNKNKNASNVYKLCVNIRKKVMNGTIQGWTKKQNGDFISYTSKNGSFTVRRNGNNIEDISFKAHGESTCTAFLGFNAIGMDRNGLRKKFGPPTMRETPPDEPDVNILSYELSDRNMTLAMYLRRARSAKEAQNVRLLISKRAQEFFLCLRLRDFRLRLLYLDTFTSRDLAQNRTFREPNVITSSPKKPDMKIKNFGFGNIMALRCVRLQFQKT